MATPEELAERAAAAAPRLTEAQRAMIAAALGPGAAASVRRHRLHDQLKRRRRVSNELDGLCGIDRGRGDEAYGSGGMTLGVDEREAQARRSAA